ncbi:membrane integrity-associated transporter subunit PqiC [Microvirga sp. SRT01]|jgi:cholesterol transport system auxiliary component|uniref:Membrane integrity-associated transporter subunit PqiC n=1 Tax=Sphingomonas longa TaxID=2778730 RepID=A0ABS2DBF2_9SPHN|nr:MULTISPECIES: ABC-type transport auxiliary lipoprotein family protein [Alphaproteobacteria]MBM6577334.1 membrane integrity-associated transporter subunit PqiC [Sphingomonas sp. BT552]MBR7710379.1 membrane integrity-associated transporter subunit PqiC [Microvirga sp. SRT01]
MKTLSIAIGLLAALPLAGCISFGATPPDTLMKLEATTQVPVGQVQNSATAKSIVIGVPVTPQSLATQRVPVATSATSVAYVKDAQWTEPPSRLFARVVSDTVSARTGRVVLSPVQAVAEANDDLEGELRTFGLDAATREAVVTFDGALQRAGQPATEKRRFEARVPVAAIDAASAGPALNQAANQVASEVADWIGR